MEEERGGGPQLQLELVVPIFVSTLLVGQLRPLAPVQEHGAFCFGVEELVVVECPLGGT